MTDFLLVILFVQFYDILDTLNRRQRHIYFACCTRRGLVERRTVLMARTNTIEYIYY